MGILLGTKPKALCVVGKNSLSPTCNSENPFYTIPL